MWLVLLKFCALKVCFWLTKRNKPKWEEKGEIIGAERGRRVLGRVTGLRRGRPPMGLRSWHPAVFITLLCEEHTHTCTHCCGHHSVGVWPEPDGHRSLFLLLSFSVMSTLNQRFSHQKKPGVLSIHVPEWMLFIPLVLHYSVKQLNKAKLRIYK